MRFLSFCLAAAPALTAAQQYAGDVISAYLPTISGAEVAFFKIPDPTGRNNNLTLLNYQSLQSNGARLVNSQLRRGIIVIHGLEQDPYDYMMDTEKALFNVKDPNVNRSTVGIIAPFFANQDNQGFAYPWNGTASTSNALVWTSTRWASGANNKWPANSRNTSSFFVMDTLVQYFANETLFPNMEQIVLLGHSLGGQMLQRYAAIGAQLNTSVPVTYWIGNPDTLIWLNKERPLTTNECPDYDDYRSGYTDFDHYPMYYGRPVVSAGRKAIQANYNTRQIAYARGLYDHGDESFTCASNTTGLNRNERFFFFIKSFPPTCPTPGNGNCDTVDLVAAGHDNGAMFNSSAGLARIFTDNFYGDGKMAYDFGIPREQAGDDPYPNPKYVNETYVDKNAGVYQGSYTYQGCWANQAPLTPPSLPTLAYNNASNTIELCTASCKADGYTIAGMSGATQCYCGDSMNQESAVLMVDSACYQACPANSQETCGGPARLSIYATAYPTFTS